MSSRLLDHLDLRVRDVEAADRFYSVILPALGFAGRWTDKESVVYEIREKDPTTEMIGIMLDRDHVPNANRIAFWRGSKDEVDAFAAVLSRAGALNVEGPMFNPEYGPGYYAVFFEDPSGNRLEVSCRTA